MKRLPLLFCILATLAMSAYGQKISLVAPIAEAELAESPANLVVIRLTLRAPGSEAEPQASLDDVQFVDCTAAVASKKPVAGVGNDPNHPMVRVCTFGVGKEASNIPTDWSSLKIHVSYKIRDAATGTFGSVKTFGDLSSITRCIKVSNVTATLGQPVRAGEREVAIPIKLNADLRLSVDLKKDDGTTTIATASGSANNSSVLFENDQSRVVTLKVLGGFQFEQGATYILSLSQLASQPLIQIEKKGLPASFTVTDFVPYKLGEVTVSENPDGSQRVKFSTSANGSLKAFLNGDSEVYSDALGPNREFSIPAAKVQPGVNTLSFTGEASLTALKLSGVTSKTFVREPRTFLKETPVVFDYDETGNRLKIRFALSRPLKTRWRFKGSGGWGADVGDPTNGQYEALVPLDLSPDKMMFVDTKLVDVNSMLKKAPLLIEIVNASKDTEVVAAFEVNFIKPNKTVTDKIQTALSQTDNKKAKSTLAEAFGFAGSLNDEQKQTIEAALSQLRAPAGSTKSKIFKVLAIAGKFAAGMFGIPLL